MNKNSNFDNSKCQLVSDMPSETCIKFRHWAQSPIPHEQLEELKQYNTDSYIPQRIQKRRNAIDQELSNSNNLYTQKVLNTKLTSENDSPDINHSQPNLHTEKLLKSRSNFKASFPTL